ncbi:MAG: YopT-type cysteine protease domain-containing protein [Acetobacteraceae bacterium]|nr:hypothetical protein [Pseudomonadota bacterium]
MRFSYNQGADPRWTASDTIVSAANTVADANALSLGTSPIKWAPTLTSEGACQGISIWWLIKRAMNDDFWTWFGPPKCAAPSSTKAYGAAGAPVAAVKTVMQGQMRIALQGGDRATNHRAAINYILSNTTGHLTNKRGLVLRQNATWKTMAYEIMVAKGYCFIGFSRKGWGGHAIAAHIMNDGAVEFMDPNLGEYDVADLSTFVNWMNDQIGPWYGFNNLDTFEMQTLSRPGQ